jgi:DNA-directed RNA polymerase specialized sigma subunit
MKNVTELLKNYKILKAEVKALELDIEELEEEVGAKPISYEERPAPTNKFNSDTENQAIDLMTKKFELEDQKRKKERDIHRIDNALDCLPITQRKLIELKYKDNETWYGVAAEVNINPRHCRRLTNEALDTMQKVINNGRN